MKGVWRRIKIICVCILSIVAGHGTSGAAVLSSASNPASEHFCAETIDGKVALNTSDGEEMIWPNEGIERQYKETSVRYPLVVRIDDTESRPGGCGELSPIISKEPARYVFIEAHQLLGSRNYYSTMIFTGDREISIADDIICNIRNVCDRQGHWSYLQSGTKTCCTNGDGLSCISHVDSKGEVCASLIKDERALNFNFIRIYAHEWALVEPKFGPLLIQLQLHSSQLMPKYISSSYSEEGGDGRADAGDGCPASNPSGNVVFVILFFSALLCGLAAFYFDQKWAGCGPYPLVLFAVIAACCSFQFHRLSNDWAECYYSTSLDRRLEDVHVLPVVILRLTAPTIGVLPVSPRPRDPLRLSQ